MNPPIKGRYHDREKRSVRHTDQSVSARWPISELDATAATYASRVAPAPRQSRVLIGLDPGELDHLRPFLRFGVNEFFKIGGRAGEDVAAEIGEALSHHRI